ncbi:MAG: phage portal protein [Massilimaliae sp.]|nr:phage portal protein [Massiliimalia sp.]
MLDSYTPLSAPELRLFEAIREGVPIIDSAIYKTVRLVGGFHLSCKNQNAQKLLDYFAQYVNVGGRSLGLESFVAGYLDSLLTYGNAVGEMVLNQNGTGISGLYNAPITNIQVKESDRPLELDFYINDSAGKFRKIGRKELVLFTALNPKAGRLTGESILKGLPFVTSILFKIYHSIGQNFERVGNIRYAVTYKPAGDMVDKAYAKERAQMIAREWTEGMRQSADGQVRDFITVGDINIKVIGADNQVIDTNIPVRHMLEQIIAKLGIPPFLLGLSWSTTERMSQQQTDILTTELEYYRRLLTPVILKICNTLLLFNGFEEEASVTWDTINLKDEVEQAHAALYRAQAKQIEANLKEGGNELSDRE